MSLSLICCSIIFFFDWDKPDWAKMFCQPILREPVRPSILAFRWSPSSLSPRKDGVLGGSSLSWCGRIDGEVKLWGREVLVLFNRFCCCWLWDGEFAFVSRSCVLPLFLLHLRLFLPLLLCVEPCGARWCRVRLQTLFLY